MIELKDFKTIVLEQKFGACRIFDENDCQVGSFPSDDLTKAGDTKDLLSHVEKVSTIYKQRLKIICSMTPSSKEVGKHTFFVGASSVQNTIQGVSEKVDVKELTAQIMLKIKTEQEAKDLKVSIQDKDDKIKELESKNGKLADIGTKIMMGVVKHFNIMGNTGNQQVALQGTKLDENATEEDKVNTALDILEKNGVDGNFLMKLALAVEKNPKLVEQVQIFL